MGSDRLWGIEIEFSAHGPSEPDRISPIGEDDLGGLAEDSPVRSWAFVHDGSCGGEAISSPGSIKNLRQDVPLICDHLKLRGYHAPETYCGVHIHVSPRSPSEALAILGTYLCYEGMLYQNLKVSPEREDRFCKPLRDCRVEERLTDLLDEGLRDEQFGIAHALNGAPQVPRSELVPRLRDVAWVWTGSSAGGAMMRGHKYCDERYAGLNLASLWLHGSVELRLFNGTLRPAQVLAYLDITEGLVRAADDVARHLEEGRPDRATEDLRDLKGQILFAVDWQGLLDGLGVSATTKKLYPNQPTIKSERPRDQVEPSCEPVDPSLGDLFNAYREPQPARPAADIGISQLAAAFGMGEGWVNAMSRPRQNPQNRAAQVFPDEVYENLAAENLAACGNPIEPPATTEPRRDS